MKRFLHFLGNSIYVVVFVYFILDCLFLSNGHYTDLFMVFETPITPRLLSFCVLILLFILRLFFRRDTIVYPVLFPFLFIFLYSVLSFILGSLFNGFSNALIDFRSIMLILVIFPIFDIFSHKLVDIHKFYYFIVSFLVLFSIFLIGVYVFQIAKGYTYSYMVWIFGKTQNKYSSLLNLSFRVGTGVYHNGLFYVTVAVAVNIVILFFFKNIKKWKRIFYLTSSVIMFAAILQSVTKGFILFILLVIAFCFVVYEIVKIRKNIRDGLPAISLLSIFAIGSAVFLTFVLIFALPNFINVGRLFDFGSQSTAIRVTFLRESFSNIFKFPIILGKFFGFHLASKGEIHLEISLLEVLLKQGLCGLFLWLVPYVLLIKLSCKNKSLELKDKMLIIILLNSVYIISFFNPHLCSVSGFIVLSFTLSEYYYSIMLSKEDKTFKTVAYIQLNKSDIEVVDVVTKKVICVASNRLTIRQFVDLMNSCKISHLLIGTHEYDCKIKITNPLVGLSNLRKNKFISILRRLGVTPYSSKRMYNECILVLPNSFALILGKTYMYEILDDDLPFRLISTGLMCCTNIEVPVSSKKGAIEKETRKYFDVDFICNFPQSLYSFFVNVKLHGFINSIKLMFIKEKYFYRIKV